MSVNQQGHLVISGRISSSSPSIGQEAEFHILEILLNSGRDTFTEMAAGIASGLHGAGLEKGIPLWQQVLP